MMVKPLTAELRLVEGRAIILCRLIMQNTLIAEQMIYKGFAIKMSDVAMISRFGKSFSFSGHPRNADPNIDLLFGLGC